MFFLLIGFMVATIIPPLLYKLANSKYSRKSLDNIMKELLGDFNIDEAITDELLVVAYDYNSQQPRFYSKYFSNEDAGVYDVPIGNATGASSAAPTYFDPKVQKNIYGLTEM